MTAGPLHDLSLSASTVQLLERFGFDRATFETLRGKLTRGEAGEERNRLRGKVEPPSKDQVGHLPAVGSSERNALAARGNAAMVAGEVAAVVLAGGMATRFGGVVKAAVE